MLAAMRDVDKAIMIIIVHKILIPGSRADLISGYFEDALPIFI